MIFWGDGRSVAVMATGLADLVVWDKTGGDGTIPSGICPIVLLGMPYAAPTRYVRVSRRLVSSTIHVPSLPLESQALR